MQGPPPGKGPLPKHERGWLVYVVTLAVAFVVFYAIVGVALWCFHAPVSMMLM